VAGEAHRKRGRPGARRSPRARRRRLDGARRSRRAGAVSAANRLGGGSVLGSGWRGPAASRRCWSPGRGRRRRRWRPARLSASISARGWRRPRGGSASAQDEEAEQATPPGEQQHQARASLAGIDRGTAANRPREEGTHGGVSQRRNAPSVTPCGSRLGHDDVEASLLSPSGARTLAPGESVTPFSHRATLLQSRPSVAGSEVRHCWIERRANFNQEAH